MTSKEIRKLFPKALHLARQDAGLSLTEAAHKAGISPLALENHETNQNLPQLEHFLDELEAYGMDFMAFHECLLEARISGRIETLENDIRQMKRVLEKTCETKN
jgi:transcriptional regulator with XRE-family HTH domain